MKLAFAIFNYFPYGGVQLDMMRIAAACLKAGHTVDIYTMSWRGEKPNEMKVHLVSVKALTNDGRAIAFSNKLQAVLAGEKYDLVIGFNKMAGLDICFVGDDCFRKRLYRKRLFFYRFLPRYRHFLALEKAVFELDSSTKIMLLTPKQQIEYHEAYQTPYDRMCLLPPGLSPSVTKHEEKNRDQILFIASNFHNKGLDRALQAFAALPHNDFKFIVVGGDDAKPFCRLVKKLKIEQHVEFLGAQDDLMPIFQRAKLLIHPARVEAAGMALLEALIEGVPVITTAICGYAFHIKDANAGVVLDEPFQQRALNQKLQAMLSEEKWRGLHENAVSYAKMADLYSMGEKAVEFIENVAWTISA